MGTLAALSVMAKHIDSSMQTVAQTMSTATVVLIAACRMELGVNLNDDNNYLDHSCQWKKRNYAIFSCYYGVSF